MWMQFDTINAAPRSKCRNGKMPLGEVPADAVKLILAPSVTYQRAASGTDGEKSRIKRRLLRHSSLEHHANLGCHAWPPPTPLPSHHE